MPSTLAAKRQAQQAEQHDILYSQFGGIASAPNGVERLRELILSLAVRGKLVPQDPNDEPASKLLEKLRAQKTKSIKEGMARKTRATEINTDEDIPYTLPPSWKWSQISEIGSVFNGNSISDDEKVSIYSKVTKGLPFVATKDVGYGRTSIVYDNGLRIPFDAPQFKIAHKGAVLICAEGGSAGKKLAITDKDICFGNKLFANEVHQGIVPKFVFYIYQSRIFRDLFRQKMTGIIGGISLNSFLRMPIPIPPYKEQERIASKIDELMEACDRLEAQQADAEAAHKILVKTLLVSLTQSQDAADFASNWRRISEHFDMLFNDEASIEELKQTALQLAVMGKLVSQNNNDEPIASLLAKLRKEKSVLFTTGKTKKSANYVEAVEGDLLFAIPITWKWIPLQNIIVFGPQNGISPRPSSRSDAPRAVTLSATTKGKFDPAFYKRVDAEIAKDSEFWLKKGDLLFQRGNAREYVGMAAYYDGKDGEFLYPDLMMKLRLSKEVSLRYVHICCVSLYARRYFSTHASGTSESMPKINQATLTELPIPLPPLAEQHRIVAKVDELMAICDTLKSRITESKTLHEQLADALVKQGAAA
jgi:type I restriction enzyme S subunit